MCWVNQRRWRLDQVFVKIRCETHYPWRAVEHERGVLEAYVTKKRDTAAALKFLKKAMTHYGNPDVLVTDKCPPDRYFQTSLGTIQLRLSFSARFPDNSVDGCFGWCAGLPGAGRF